MRTGVPSSPASPPRTGAIRGKVTIGPVSPVQRAGQPVSDRPYRATLAILDPAGQEVARVASDEDGEFWVDLPEGRYLLQPVPGGWYPRAQTLTVTVSADQVTRVAIRYDSGIR